jgi:hypothetical protein
LVSVYFVFKTKRKISEILLLSPSEIRRLFVVSNWRPVAGGVGQ